MALSSYNVATEADLNRQVAKKTGKQNGILRQTDAVIKKITMSYDVLRSHTIYLEWF